MRLKSKILLSVFCLVLMSFVFMSTEDIAYAQADWCCNNNNAMGGSGQCVQSPNGIQSCGGANVFFEDGVNGIVLAPLGNTDPPFPQSGDLCPSAAQDRETCMCIDANGATVPCQDLPPPPTNPPPTDPPPTDPPPTDPPPTNPPPTDPPPTDPPPTDPPPTDPPPTDPPPTNPPPTDPPPTDPPPTNPPPTDPPPTDPPPTEAPPATPTPTPIPITGEGCCVEAEGLCAITSGFACEVPPNLEFMGEGTNCDNVAACNLPPPPPPVTEVPTMSEWGLIATAVMLGLFSLITVRRGFRINNK